MTLSSQQYRELHDLAGALCDGTIDAERFGRLEAVLAGDLEAQRFYVRYLNIHAALHRLNIGGEPRAPEFTVPGPGLSVPALGASVELPHQPETPSPEPLIPPIIIDTSTPAPSSFLSFSSSLGGWLFSYAAATVIMGAAILGAWVCRVSHDYRSFIAETHAGPALPAEPSSPAGPAGQSPVVGQITALADCLWTSPGARRSAAVFLGRKYTVESGLMEITYRSGAKVILQGPCMYEVESPSGGFLSLGKLTARVEKGSGVRDQGSEHYPLATSHYPLFAVRTPNAVITDLGTEFGVEVERSGVTRSHVFRGKVQLRPVAGEQGVGQAVELRAGESAAVAPSGGSAAVVRQGEPLSFVRQMPAPAPIELYSTGVGLKEGQADPHWQLVARSDDPKFKPRPALVTPVYTNGNYTLNDPRRSQWISLVADVSDLPNEVTYTFRTTFDLGGLSPQGAVIRGKFLADNRVDAIRLNGRRLKVPDQELLPPYVYWTGFKIDGGFVEGVNVLEFDVFNGDERRLPNSFMAFRTELTGMALGNPMRTSDDNPPSDRGKEGIPMN